jgi:hypothetical protein
MNTTDPVDLEALRGFTPGDWRWSAVGPTTFELVAGIERVLYRRGDKTGLQHGTINADQVDGPDARLIAAAPSMHAELTARRARDAEVEALVAALRVLVDNGGIGPESMFHDARDALLPFTGAKP